MAEWLTRRPKTQVMAFRIVRLFPPDPNGKQVRIEMKFSNFSSPIKPNPIDPYRRTKDDGSPNQ